jgi:uncharacterized protein (DUF305 family)
MRWGLVAGIVAVVILAGGAAYLVRGLAPSEAAIAEGRAFTIAHNGMMIAMSNAAFTGNADADFARLMVPHHQGAVDMAAVELKYGSDQAVVGLAARIAAAQQPEIDAMTAWQKAHTAPAAPGADAGAVKSAYSAANDKMMNAMMGDSMAHSGNADRDFVKMMIPHHQGAIEMANVQLKYGGDPQLKALALKIVAAQEAEIAEMNGWLKANGG